MGTAPTPILDLRVDTTLGTTVHRSSALPSWVRKPLTAWLFPHVLRNAVETLSGERLGQLTPDEAEALYRPLLQFHIEVTSVLENVASRPWIIRKLTAGWVERVGRESEELADILEALAWGSDPKLREFVDQSIGEIEALDR